MFTFLCVFSERKLLKLEFALIKTEILEINDDSSDRKHLFLKFTLAKINILEINNHSSDWKYPKLEYASKFLELYTPSGVNKYGLFHSEVLEE